MAHIGFKTHYPRCKIAARYEPPHERRNKAIDVPLVSARVYPVSTKEEHSNKNQCLENLVKD